ncbi:MAG: hypothetical protein QW597_01160 [Thermoplasmataceae archaeon]
MRRIVVVASVTFMVILSSGMPLLSQMSSSHAPEDVVQYYPTGQNFVNYTIYISQGAYPRSLLMNYLNESRISSIPYGNIVQVSVPTRGVQGFLSAMTLMRENFNLSYFEDTESFSFTPYVYTQQISGNGLPYYPSDIATAYGYNGAYSSGITGTGQTIVIVDAYGDPNLQYDLMAFDKVMNIPPANLSIVFPNGAEPQHYSATWSLETATDVEWAHAMAPGARIVLVISTDAAASLMDALSYAINEKLGNIISLSWGNPESQLGINEIETLSKIFQQAQNENISVFAASGDLGAYDGTSGLTVNFPASDPFVTGVGGTSLYAPGWSQQAWGGISGGSTFGSGGGYSQLPVPYWQIAPGINSTSRGRGVPDVSMVGNTQTGVEVIQSGRVFDVGGTSIGCPMWAAIGALIDQANQADIGSLNPMLYQISRIPLYNSAFSQITKGNNGKYNATAGWNPVTGLGTPVVSSLINASKEIRSQYGTVAVINSSGYGFSTLSANVTFAGFTQQYSFNGSSFFYISAYYSQNQFIKVGINISNTSLFSAVYDIEQNGRTASGKTRIEMANRSVHLSLSINGTNITGLVGPVKFDLSYLLTFIGEYQAAFGAQVDGAEYNLVNLSGAYFSNITVKNGSEISPLADIYLEEYSGIPGKAKYSTLSFSRSGPEYSVNYLVNATTKYLNGGPTESKSIVYHLYPSNVIYATFNLTGNVPVNAWKVNNSTINGNSYTFTHGGYYLITAETGNTTVPFYNRTVFIPVLLKTNLTISDSLNIGYSGTIQGVLDNFYNLSALKSGSQVIESIYGTNYISLIEHDFYPVEANFTAGINTSLILQPIKSTVSLFVFQGNSTVIINGRSLNGINGTYTENILPGNVSIGVSSPDYSDFNSTVTLSPGQNLNEQINLNIAGNNFFVSGYVTDINFGFGLSNTKVEEQGSHFVSYTNASGFYFIQVPLGYYLFVFSNALYKNLTYPEIVEGFIQLNIKMTPRNVSVLNLDLNIQKYFPLMFFAAYLTWDTYPGLNFSSYNIEVSTTPSFSPGSVDTFTYTNQAQNDALITGIYPTHTYYVELVVHLNDGSIYASNYVTLSYGNAVFLLANIALVGGPLFLVGLIIYPFVRRDRKYS